MELKIENVTKTYGKKQALINFSLDFYPGVYGLLGPNGAGKSTLIGIIAGLVKADCGSVVYIDNSGRPVNLNKQLGYLPQYQSSYKGYTAVEFLKYICALKDYKPKDINKYCGDILELVNLSDAGKKHIGAFSGGMKQRLGIGQALIGEPDILIFDEPTAGLDPKERVRFRNIISSLGSNKIVILATHIVSDISYIANEIILLSGGKIIDYGREKDIISKITDKVWECKVPSDEVISVMNKFKVSNVISRQEECIVRIVSDEKPFDNAKNTEPNLEDVCLYEFGEL